MKIRRVLGVLCFIAIAAFSIGFAFAQHASAENRRLDVKVMTRNMDPGADPAAIAQADFDDPNSVLTVVQGIVDSIYDSRITERAALIAAEIARTKPDLVALQEATTWNIEMASPPVEIDQLTLLLNALKAFGQHYKVAAYQTLTDVEMPGLIRYTDHDVILVRSDLPREELSVSRPETHVYEALMDFPVGDKVIKVLRGWIAVEVKIHGARFKFVDTHLESPIPYPPEYVAPTQYVQELQATQLMEDLEDVKLPIILAGDFNSDAEHTLNYPSDNSNSYSIIAGTNFKDAWDKLRPNTPGFTWSLMEVPYTAPGVNFTPFERIDLIFSDGPEAVSIMRTEMEKVNGVYASDHAGVVAVFDLMNPHPLHHGRSYRYYPVEYPGFHLPAHVFKYFWFSGFRRH